MNCFPLDNLIKHAVCFKLVSSSGMNLIITNQRKAFYKIMHSWERLIGLLQDNNSDSKENYM